MFIQPVASCSWIKDQLSALLYQPLRMEILSIWQLVLSNEWMNSKQAIEIMRKNPKVLYARNEWGNMAMKVRAEYGWKIEYR